VRGCVEETFALLDAEADQLCNAKRYERIRGQVIISANRWDGHYERYRRRESLVEEALIELYLARVSVRRVEDITALWRTRESRSTISDLTKRIHGTIEASRNPPIAGEHLYV
jgi:putative transposase